MLLCQEKLQKPPHCSFHFLYCHISSICKEDEGVCVCVSVWQGLSITLASPKLARRPSLLLTDTEGPGSASQALGLTVCITVVSLATLKVVMHLQGFMCADAGQCYHHCTDILWKENQTICHQQCNQSFCNMKNLTKCRHNSFNSEMRKKKTGVQAHTCAQG